MDVSSKCLIFIIRQHKLTAGYWRKIMKYKIIPKDVVKSIIEFLDEVQFDAAKSGTPDDLHKVNFCSWIISELMYSIDGFDTEEELDDELKKTKDDTIIDYNLPEDMSDEEINKLKEQFEKFLDGWDKEYNKSNTDKPFNKPQLNDVAEYMSLEEIKDYLLDDESLTNQERFELYYDEHRRVQKQKERKKSKPLNKMLKDLGINPPKKNKKK